MAKLEARQPPVMRGRAQMLSLATAILVLTSYAPPARAADPAEVLVREGVELRRAGRDVDALEKFKEAYDLSHTPRAAAQLGLCQMALDNFVEAEGYLTEALAAQSDPWIARNRSIIEESITKARTHLGAVVVTGGPNGALVTVNGKMIGKLPKAPKVFAAPGPVVVGVSAAGFQNETKKVALKAGEVLQVPVTLASTASAERALRDDSAPQSPTLQPANEQSIKAEKTGIAQVVEPEKAQGIWKPTAGWISLSAGAIALALGANFHLQRESKAKTFNRRDDCGKLGDQIFGGQECESLDQSVSSATTLAIVGYASAAVFGGLGVYWLLGGSSGDSGQDQAKVSVGVGPSTVFVSGAF